MTTDAVDLQTLSIGLLITRVIIGLVMAAHGTQKLFGWFGGYGLHQTGEFFAQLGWNSGRSFAAAASVVEITSGLLVALGLFGPVGPALMISVMLVAAISVHWSHGLFASTNGIEVPLLYSAAAIGIALIGPGAYSLDAQLGIAHFWNPTNTLIVLALGIIGGLGNLALRKRGVIDTGV
jgi:putative oxidoreductase